MLFEESISADELDRLPLASFDGVISVIDEEDDQFAEAIEYLRSQRVIGFDTETKPCFQSGMPRNRMALLQLSGEDKSFIFRLQHLGLPKALAGILSSGKYLKVGAAVHDDVKGLQSYRKFVPRAFIDLQKVVQSYGIREKSVRKMSAIILGVKVSKSQQLSNWEAQRLSEAQVNYAALDAWICREMYKKLMGSNISSTLW